MENLPRRLAAVTVLAMFLVLMGGTLVTKTGSGEACGDTWPLCRGQWLPPLETKAIIEYSHRLVSTFSGFLILAMAAVVWRRHRDQAEIRFLILSAVVFLLVQGALGAWAVM
ncbi:MAG: COX15/CtaA family protein, partial [Thermaerobacterales bacterium]